ncbi:pyridoxal-phosphate dependent enzyme family/ornithine cyclodeaminase family protein, partial [Pseudomonas savastanoi pv. glycinea str. race 4]
VRAGLLADESLRERHQAVYLENLAFAAEQAKGAGDTILIESSSGNLGVALAMICAERAIPFTCVVDPNSSSHNVRMMR